MDQSVSEDVDEDYVEENEDEQYVDEEEEEDDAVGLLKPAFDLQQVVAQEDISRSSGGRSRHLRYKSDEPPSDGLEYLYQVR